MFLPGNVPPARLEALARKRARRGLPTPMIDDKPVLFMDLQLAWDGWQELTLSRDWRTDGEPKGLLHSELREWLDLNRIDNDELRSDLYRAIKLMDMLWMSMRKERLTKKKERGNTRSSDRSKKRGRR